MAWDPVAEVAHIDALIHRVTAARVEAVAHGSIILTEIHDQKLDELTKLRELLVPNQRTPDDVA